MSDRRRVWEAIRFASQGATCRDRAPLPDLAWRTDGHVKKNPDWDPAGAKFGIDGYFLRRGSQHGELSTIRGVSPPAPRCLRRQSALAQRDNKVRAGPETFSVHPANSDA